MLILVGCTGGIDGSAGPGTRADGTISRDFEPAEPVLSRLTETQYRNALRDLLGEPLPQFELEPDTYPHLFSSIGAATTSISERGVGQWEGAALESVNTVMADAARRDALLGCTPAAPDDACVSDFLARFGRRAWRRALTQEEIDRYVRVAREAANGDVYRGVRYATAGLLQSPNFLYRVELGEPANGKPYLRYSSLELASRLSFFFWNSIPDEELLSVGESGSLTDPQVYAEQVERLLSDEERVRETVVQFFAEYLSLYKLETITRNVEHYPQFAATTPDSMRGEIERMISHTVFEQDSDFRDVFSTTVTFANPDIATLYDIQMAEPGWTMVDLSLEAPERGGLLTTPGLLALYAHADRTSPTRRGQFVRQRLLCESVAPPPAAVELPEESPGLPPDATLRERLAAHRDDPGCAACHAMMDPIGLGLEDFDAIGMYRTTENNRPVDASGDLDGTPFEGARDLGLLLAEDPRTARCVSEQVLAFANNRLLTLGEHPSLDAVVARFEAEGFHFIRLLAEVAHSDAFKYLAESGAQSDSEEQATTAPTTEQEQP